MPTSGKTTLAQMVREETGLRVIELDDIITEKLGTSIRECFETYGEEYFRDLETETAESVRGVQGCIISCGGGIIRRPGNMEALSENGIVLWIDRAPAYLFASESRPLSSSLEAVRRLYEERKELYRKYCDVRIENNGTLKEAAEQILQVIRKENT